MLDEWAGEDDLRFRLVSGKQLLKRIRGRLRQEHDLAFYPTRVIRASDSLAANFMVIEQAIFPKFTEDSAR